MMTMDRFGAESLHETGQLFPRLLIGVTDRMMRRCVIASAAGATKARKSDGVIQEGTARTPNITESGSDDVGDTDSIAPSSSWDGLFVESRNIWTVPSGRFVDPDFVRV